MPPSQQDTVPQEMLEARRAGRPDESPHPGLTPQPPGLKPLPEQLPEQSAEPQSYQPAEGWSLRLQPI